MGQEGGKQRGSQQARTLFTESKPCRIWAEQRAGMQQETGRRFRREGMRVYPRLIHVGV